MGSIRASFSKTEMLGNSISSYCWSVSTILSGITLTPLTDPHLVLISCGEASHAFRSQLLVRVLVQEYSHPPIASWKNCTRFLKVFALQAQEVLQYLRKDNQFRAEMSWDLFMADSNPENNHLPSCSLSSPLLIIIIINKCDQLMCQAQMSYSPLESLQCYIVCVLFDNSTESIKYITCLVLLHLAKKK